MEITLNRSRLQEIHEVLRQLADRRSSSPLSDKVLVRAEPGRLSIVATNGDVDVFHQTAATENQTTAQFLVPLATLAELAKGKEGPVQLSGEIVAQAEIEKYPTLPADGVKRFHHADWPVLRDRLRNAASVIASAQGQYSINRICLTQGSVVSTDSHQLYAGNSLALPLRKGQECLIAPSKILGSKSLADFTQVGLARDEKGIIFRFGENWTVRLYRQQGRFPNWQSVVPKLEEAKAKLTIPEAITATLPERLHQLFDGTNTDTRLSLKLGAKITLAAVDMDGKEVRSTELLDVTRSGEEMTLLFDPKYLLHALKLGFLTLHFFAPNRPVVATKGTDLYLWMPVFEEIDADTIRRAYDSLQPQDRDCLRHYVPRLLALEG